MSIKFFSGFLVMCFCFSITGMAQSSNTDKKPVFDEKPVPGYDFSKYLREQIKYPAKAKENNKEGKVFVQFTINTDGSISDVSLVNHVDHDLDKEAVRVITDMPNWQPGKLKGKPVKVSFTQPISFQLDDDTKNLKTIGAAKEVNGIEDKVVFDERPAPDFDLSAFLRNNINYPKHAMDNNIEGRVVVKFVVNEDGSITDVSIAKSVNAELDNEAMRVVRAMPPWKPGKLKGKPVRVYFTQPITFKL